MSIKKQTENARQKDKKVSPLHTDKQTISFPCPDENITSALELHDPISPLELHVDKIS